MWFYVVLCGFTMFYNDIFRISSTKSKPRKLCGAKTCQGVLFGASLENLVPCWNQQFFMCALRLPWGKLTNIDVEKPWKTMVSWKMIIDSWLFHINSVYRLQKETNGFKRIDMWLSWTLDIHCVYIYKYNIIQYTYDVITHVCANVL